MRAHTLGERDTFNFNNGLKEPSHGGNTLRFENSSGDIIQDSALMEQQSEYLKVENAKRTMPLNSNNQLLGGDYSLMSVD